MAFLPGLAEQTSWQLSKDMECRFGRGGRSCEQKCGWHKVRRFGSRSRKPLNKGLDTSVTSFCNVGLHLEAAISKAPLASFSYIDTEMRMRRCERYPKISPSSGKSNSRSRQTSRRRTKEPSMIPFGISVACFKVRSRECTFPFMTMTAWYRSGVARACHRLQTQTMLDLVSSDMSI